MSDDDKWSMSACEKDRQIDLRFQCYDCGSDIHVTSEQDLFGMIDTQVASETRKLLCDNCND